MIVIDTSIWISLFRTGTASAKSKLAEAVGQSPVVFAPFVVTELLQGAKDDAEWDFLVREIKKFDVLELGADAWVKAARIYFDLKRGGNTVRSTVDCLIAQLCVEHDATLLHNDRDFERIASKVPLKHLRLDLSV